MTTATITKKKSKLETLNEAEEALLLKAQDYGNIQRFSVGKLCKASLSWKNDDPSFSNEDLLKPELSKQIALINEIDEYVSTMLEAIDAKFFYNSVLKEPRTMIKALVNGKYYIPGDGLVDIEEYKKYTS